MVAASELGDSCCRGFYLETAVVASARDCDPGTEAVASELGQSLFPDIVVAASGRSSGRAS